MIELEYTMNKTQMKCLTATAQLRKSAKYEG